MLSRLPLPRVETRPSETMSLEWMYTLLTAERTGGGKGEVGSGE